MGPIELTFFGIGIVVTLVGLVRGYARELGSTLIILVAIFILTFFESQLVTVIEAFLERVLGVDSESVLDVWLSAFFTITFVLIVFAGYAGHTLTFTGTPAPPPQGTLLSLAIGILNGYLIAGTVWYYQDAYGYPICRPAECVNQLTERAEQMIQYLPPNLFENPVYWIVPVAVLLIIRVRA